MRKEKYLRTWACPAGNLCKTHMPQQPGRSSTESRSSWGLPCLSLKVCSPSPQQRAQGNEKPNTVGVTNTWKTRLLVRAVQHLTGELAQMLNVRFWPSSTAPRPSRAVIHPAQSKASPKSHS